MIIECPHCQARYHFSEDRFSGLTRKKVRCFKCSEVFSVENPAAGRDPSPPGGDASSEGGTQPLPMLDFTASRRRRKGASDSAAVAARIAPGESTELHLPEGVRFSLAVISGPDAGKVFRIDSPRVVIGRGSGDIALEDLQASRAHAAIEIRESVVLLEDLGSTNGTVHKGKAIDEPTQLHNHSEFSVGATTLMLIVTRE